MPDDLVLVAASFEPRCLEGTRRLLPKVAERALVVQYADTLDSAAGLANIRRLREMLRERALASPDTVLTSFADPYGAVRQVGRWLEATGSPLNTLTIDCSCFTKLHLLTLLKYLDGRSPMCRIRFLYAEPLTYATAFGRSLSFGIRRTVHMPLSPGRRDNGGAALLVFLGHEEHRAMRVIRDVEADQTILLLGRPGFSPEMCRISERRNAELISRARFDGHFKLARCSNADVGEIAMCVRALIEELASKGLRTFYVAPLGTKLQALGLFFGTRACPGSRVVLAYPIPKRYERAMYSQGVGPMYVIAAPRLSQPLSRQPSGPSVVELGEWYFVDPLDISAEVSHLLDVPTRRQLVRRVIGDHYAMLSGAFARSPRLDSVLVCARRIVAETEEVDGLGDDHIADVERSQGSLCLRVTRADWAEGSGSANPSASGDGPDVIGAG